MVGIILATLPLISGEADEHTFLRGGGGGGGGGGASVICAPTDADHYWKRGSRN